MMKSVQLLAAENRVMALSKQCDWKHGKYSLLMYTHLPQCLSLVILMGSEEEETLYLYTSDQNDMNALQAVS